MIGREPQGFAAFFNGVSPDAAYLRPLVTKRPGAEIPPDFLPLGTSAAFAHVELIRRGRDGASEIRVAPLQGLLEWLNGTPSPLKHRLALLLTRLSSSPRVWAGLTLNRPLVMGIINATPDSFSDGGRFTAPVHAIEQGRAFMAAGADIIDIGGESTRPGAQPIGAKEEIQRVLPVISALADAGAVISVDTRHAPVMRAALDAGARIVNDITALSEPEAAALAIERDIPVVLMHMQGEPATMQDAPHYRDAALDVFDFLNDRVTTLEALGLSRNRIMLDPGIGFGKTPRHNVALLKRLGLFLGIGCGLLVGASRKGFIAKIAQDQSSASQRLGGSLAIAVDAIAQGANVVRVHDVAETVQALRVLEAIEGT